ncbi:ABC transporter permease [Jiangella ureilytica]|uniref:ABC transporter permease n=2 Tax=Jiangella ureilytica TaxID=2530374 RepID=A0A4R4RT44_9ACTN|nr:ABC transporter permease [Jiangella ureilytica]
MLAGSDPTEEMLQQIRERLGLDVPVWQQYVTFLGDIVRGDLGDSYSQGVPAVELVAERLPATLLLAVLALLLAIVISIPIGVIAAIRPGSLIDSVARVLAVLGQSVPVFWLAILMIIFFAVNLRILPAGGTGTWQHLVLPAVALSISSVPLTMRLTRSALLEVLNKDYIRTARAKGLREWEVVIKHGLRNALIPIVTVLTLRLGDLIGGAIVLEQVFAYPGLGRLAVQALHVRDFPVIQAFIIVTAAAIILINLIADVIYTVVDPRVRVN